MQQEFSSEETTGQEPFRLYTPAPVVSQDAPAVHSLAGNERVTLLLAKLRRNGLLFRRAQRILETGQLTAEDTSALLDMLHDNTAKYWRQRELAAWLLGLTMDGKRTKASVELAAVLQRQRVSINIFWKQSVSTAFGSRLALLTSLYFLWRFLRHYHDDLFLKVIVFAIIYCFCSVFYNLLLSPFTLRQITHRTNDLRFAMLASMERLGQPESVGAVASALHDHSAKVRRAAEDALQRLLPTLTEAHYGKLEMQAVPNLCRALNNADEPLALSVLAALAKIGDGRAIAPVQCTEPQKLDTI